MITDEMADIQEGRRIPIGVQILIGFTVIEWIFYLTILVARR